MRIKRGTISHRRHKKLLARAKGYRGGRHNLFKEARQAVIHAGVDSYRGRKEKKQQMRALWIIRLNAALREHNVSYSQFIALAKAKKVELDRKVLSQIAIENPETFAQVVKKIT